MCFSDEEVITVGSSAYNLAGDVARRGNFMKNNILNLIFSGVSNTGLGKGIVDAHIAGPATSYNRFSKWAEDSGYNTQVGNAGGLVYNASALSPAGFVYLVPVKSTHDQRAITFSISALDLNLIALEWIINNTPENKNLAFKATLEKVAGVLTGDVLITYTSGITQVFTSSYDLNNGMPFVYLYHEERLKVSIDVNDTGWVTNTPPVKVGFSGLPTTVNQNVSQNKTTTTVTTYSDSTPTTTDVVVDPQNLVFPKTTGTYVKLINVAATPTVVGSVTTFVQDEESFYNVLFDSVTTVSSSNVGGVTVTTTTTTVTPSLEIYWKYKQVATTSSQEKWMPYLLKIYQKGTDPLGDSLLFNVPTTTQKFFPIIPLRRDNVMVDLAHFPTQYGWNRKAARKCFGTKKKYNNLIDSLADNPSLGDIDHAWVVFGVSLSTKQQDGQKYLYEFFKNLSESTISALGTYKSAVAYEAAWVAFAAATTVSTNDETGTAIPTRPMPPVAQEYTIVANASTAAQDWLYNTTITGKGGGQVVGSGYHIKSLNKVGHCWAYAKNGMTLSIPTYDADDNITYTDSTTTVIAFGKQVTVDNWVEYEFFDLVHVNNVYQGITATTLGSVAILSTDENSSFIIPLQEQVFSDLTLVRRTQLSLECAFLVVNYYNKQTIPWYASGFFQIVVVVVIIVVAVYSGGSTMAASSGILGDSIYVGLSLGFTGTAAIVAGVIANALAAAIVSALIMKVSTRFLGEDVGRIVGLIAAMITVNLMSSTGPFNLADSWAQMTKVDNLIKISMSGVQEYGNYLQGQAMEVSAKTQALILESNESLKEIKRLTQELMGDSDVSATTITNAIRYATENPAQFFSRTTMTGTEIAEISIKLVEDFPAPQLALPYLD